MQEQIAISMSMTIIYLLSQFDEIIIYQYLYLCIYITNCISNLITVIDVWSDTKGVHLNSVKQVRISFLFLLKKSKIYLSIYINININIKRENMFTIPLVVIL